MFTYAVTDDITLELQAPHHAPLLYQLVESNRRRFDPYHGWVSRVHSVSDMQNFMLRELKGMAHSARWAWMLRYQGEPAGRIALWINNQDSKECEFSYWLAEHMTGKGIVTRAMRVILDFAFGDLGLNHALIGFTESNLQSQKVAERLGFKLEFEAREMGNYTIDGTETLKFCGMLRSEWQSKHTPHFRYRLSETADLRLAEPRQARDFYQQTKATMSDLKQWFVSMNFPYSLEREQRYIQRRLEDYAIGEGLMVGIYDEGVLAGAMTLTIQSANRIGQVGYWLAPAHRGKGLVTQAARAIIHFGFTHYQLNRIYARIAEGNTSSIAVAERLAMQREAVLREEVICQGKPLNHIVYGLLHSEWLANNHPSAK